MSVLMSSTGAMFSFGDVSDTTNATMLSMCLTLKRNSAAIGSRIFGQMQDDGLNTGFMIQPNASGQPTFVAGINGSWLRIYRAASVSFQVGIESKIFVRWEANVRRQINFDGVDQSLTTDVSVGTESNIGNPGSALTVGGASGSTCTQGDYGEVGLWLEYVPDDFVTAYMRGYSVKNYMSRNAVIVVPGFNVTTFFDIVKGKVSTGTGTLSNADHPRIILPRRRALQFPAGVSPPPPPPAVLEYSQNRLPLLGVS